MIIQLSLAIYTYPTINFRKIDMTTKNSGGFIRFPHPPHLLFIEGDDAMALSTQSGSPVNFNSVIGKKPFWEVEDHSLIIHIYINRTR